MKEGKEGTPKKPKKSRRDGGRRTKKKCEKRLYFNLVDRVQEGEGTRQKQKLKK